MHEWSLKSDATWDWLNFKKSHLWFVSVKPMLAFPNAISNCRASNDGQQGGKKRLKWSKWEEQVKPHVGFDPSLSAKFSPSSILSPGHINHVILFNQIYGLVRYCWGWWGGKANAPPFGVLITRAPPLIRLGLGLRLPLLSPVGYMFMILGTAGGMFKGTLCFRPNQRFAVPVLCVATPIPLCMSRFHLS